MHRKDGRFRNSKSRNSLDFLGLSDNMIIVLSLILSVVGLVMLLIFSQELTPDSVSISAIHFLPENDYISFVGHVSKINQRGQYQHIVVCDSYISSDCVSVLVLDANVPPGLVEGDFISVIGTVESGFDGKYVSIYGKEGIEIR